jgi:hypothetical protein
MISLSTFTAIHVVISLVGIASGVVVLWGLLASRPLEGWTAVFLGTTLATSLTGFGFPFHEFLPSHAVGILSLAVLAVAIVARYVRHLARGWRSAYVITAVMALYFNVFVLVVQLFLKVPALHALAPAGSEPPFLIVQSLVLIGFVWLGYLATVRFAPSASRRPTAA